MRKEETVTFPAKDPESATAAPDLDTAPPAPAPDRILAGLGTGWTLLRDCTIGGPAETPVRIDLALLHPSIGVALLELPPHWTPDAPGRLLRRLEMARFQAIFPGHLPVAHRRLRRQDLAELPRLLDEAFAAQPPLSLPGGDAWTLAVRRALLEDPVARPSPVGRPRDGRQSARGPGISGQTLLLMAAALGVGVATASAVLMLPPSATAPAQGVGAPEGPPVASAPATPPLPTPAEEPAREAAAAVPPPPPSPESPTALATGRPSAPSLARRADPDPVPPPGVVPPDQAAAPVPEPNGLPVPPSRQNAPQPVQAAPTPAALPAAAAPGTTPRPAIVPAPEPDRPATVLPPDRPSQAATVPTTATAPAPPPQVEQVAPAAEVTAAPGRPMPSVAAPVPSPASTGASMLSTVPPAEDRPAPVAASPAPAAAAQGGTAAAALLGALVRRGDVLFELGDVSGARRFYERAAEAGSAEAAIALGRTFDPAVLEASGARGIRPDPAAAANWYRRAEALRSAAATQATQDRGANR